MKRKSNIRLKLQLILLILIVVISGCTPDTNDTIESETQQTVGLIEQINILDQLNLTDGEQAYIESIRERGYFKTAIREIASVYREVDGKGTGYNYTAIKRFADDVGVELELVSVDNISVYFEKDGIFSDAVKTDPTLVYKPDLFDEVDVYTDMLTQLPWREKFMNFIGFTPIRELVISQNGLEIKSIQDLNGKTFAVQSASSYMNTLLEIEALYGFEMDYLLTDTISESLVAVNEGRADLTVMDSNRAFIEMVNYDNLEVGIPVTDVKYVGWAVAKDNPELTSILTKYMDALINDGSFNEMWLMDYDISFYEYYTLILQDAGILELMNLSAAELEYIEDMKEKGVLNVAMQDIVTGYNVVDGNPTGYNHLLVRELAEVLDVELNIKIIDRFAKYFWKDGKTPEQLKLDENYFYVPDMFSEVDIYCDNLTHIPWRQQILSQIEGVPVRTVLVQKSTLGIKTFQDLNGLTIAILKDSSYEDSMNELIEKHQLDVNVIDVRLDVEGFEAIENNLADATIVDSDLGFLFLKEYDGLEIVLPTSEIGIVGWAVRKDNDVLASILTKYIEAMKQNGKFDVYWKMTYDITYAEYLRLLID